MSPRTTSRSRCAWWRRYTQLLARRYQGKLDEDADEFIGFAVDGARRMQELINDLLTYSRVGTRALQLEAVDTSQVVDQVVSDLAAAIEDSGASVTRDDAADRAGRSDAAPPAVPEPDRQRHQVPPPGRAAAGARLGRAGATAAWTFSVSDNGIGIEPQYLERIFVLFQRLHTRADYPGTGIGLAICKKIVERHGGQIRVDSEPGRGTTFEFTLPQSASATGGSRDQRADRRADRSRSCWSRTTRRCAPDRSRVSKRARSATTCTSPETASRRWRSCAAKGDYADAVRPDLILLDLNLPRMDGREVLSEIKSDPRLKTIPVVVLTTSRAEQDVLRSYELQANCYITKPVDLGAVHHRGQIDRRLLVDDRHAAASDVTQPGCPYPRG